jgi:hypothetical protein
MTLVSTNRPSGGLIRGPGRAIWFLHPYPGFARSDKTPIDSKDELQYLRAMAELGSEPQQAKDVAKLLNRTSEQLGPTRSRLIDKGLLYTPGHGLAAFTVPQFDRYMRRAHELRARPPQRRARRRS